MAAWNDVNGLKTHNHEAFPTWDTFSRVYCPVPSDNYLTDIFFDHYHRNEDFYEDSFHILTAKSLSSNHTFKVSVHIGFQRPGNSTWTKQYDSLFMIMNEEGQVLGFQLSNQLHLKMWPIYCQKYARILTVILTR